MRLIRRRMPPPPPSSSSAVLPALSASTNDGRVLAVVHTTAADAAPLHHQHRARPSRDCAKLCIARRQLYDARLSARRACVTVPAIKCTVNAVCSLHLEAFVITHKAVVASFDVKLTSSAPEQRDWWPDCVVKYAVVVSSC